MYTAAQLEKMKELARDYLYFFNYVDHPSAAADPQTTFFTYDKETQHDEAKLALLFNGYKNRNTEALQRALQEKQATFAFNESHPCSLNLANIGRRNGRIAIKEPSVQ